MIVVTVARKPFSGSVARNMEQHGTGGINIDACRVGWPNGQVPQPGTTEWGGATKGYSFTPTDVRGLLVPRSLPSDLGRWPPNLIFAHREGCKALGPRKVKGTQPPGLTLRKMSGWSSRTDNDTGKRAEQYADDDGNETVTVWECVADCPVADLDQQSIAGGIHGAGSPKPPEYRPQNGNFVAYSLAGGSFRVGDVGGASRFFPVVQRCPTESLK
jgi:hypothetical protein